MNDPVTSRRRGGRAARVAGVRPTPPEGLPDDAALTTRGMRTGAGGTLILACGALAREIVALIRANGWAHMHLHCLPAILHNTPGAIPREVDRALAEIPHETALVAYADCGTGGALAEVCARHGAALIPGPHCYAFFERVDAFSARTSDGADMRSFYVTDFLTRQFDAFVTRPLGLDRHPELREAYFGHYETLVYQAQTDDPALTEMARRHAEALGLGFERRFTGYGDLADALNEVGRASTRRAGPSG